MTIWSGEAKMAEFDVQHIEGDKQFISIIFWLILAAFGRDGITNMIELSC